MLIRTAPSQAFLAFSGASNVLFVFWRGLTDSAQNEAGRLFHKAKFWDVGQVAAILKANYDTRSPSHAAHIGSEAANPSL